MISRMSNYLAYGGGSQNSLQYLARIRRAVSYSCAPPESRFAALSHCRSDRTSFQPGQQPLEPGKEFPSAEQVISAACAKKEKVLAPKIQDQATPEVLTDATVLAELGCDVTAPSVSRSDGSGLHIAQAGRAAGLKAHDSVSVRCSMSKAKTVT